MLCLKQFLDTILSDSGINWFGKQWGFDIGLRVIPKISSATLQQAIMIAEELHHGLQPISYNPEHKKRLSMAILGLQSIYPINDLGQKGFEAREKVFQEIMGEYPIDIVEVAAREYASKHDWFPTPHQWLEYIMPKYNKLKTRYERIKKLIEFNQDDASKDKENRL